MGGADGMFLRAQISLRNEPHLLRAFLTGLTGLLLGVLLVVQLQTQRAMRRTALAAGPEPMVVLSTLVEANARLRQEQTSLESQLAEVEKTSPQERLTALVEELNRLRIANGLAEVTGPGVEVTIAGSLSPLELQDLVNELRNVGAEATALNAQRLVASSAIASSGEGLVVNGERLEPPYVLRAIGNAQGMYTALTRQGGMITLLAQNHEREAPAVAQRAQMVLPVYTSHFELDYARPIE